MSWDTWESLPVEQSPFGNDAKRPRLDHWNGAAGVQLGASSMALAFQQLAPPAPLTGFAGGGHHGGSIFAPSPTTSQLGLSGGGSITQQIVDALQGRGITPGLAAPAAQPAPAVPETALGPMLLDSLRSLLPAGESVAACQSSAVGQELFRVVQHMAPTPAVLAPGPFAVYGSTLQVAAQAAPLLAPSAVKQELLVKEEILVKEEVEERDHSRLPRSRAAAPRRQDPVLREDDVESDDGVPHRLPPGFGAIPEDIVEERARQREEQRILQLKATQPCRFGKRCKKRDCPNAHPEGRDIDTAWNPCAFGRRCKRKGCFYDHPEGRIIDDNPEKGMCKFGARCSRPDCLYDHPEGRAPLSGPDPRICYFCHDPGHLAADCPRNPESWNYNRQALGQIVHVPDQKAIMGNM